MADDTLRVLGDRYEIHQRLARGGMAQVYLARDRSLDRPVAVKELAPEFAVDQTFVERFRREAQAAANLANPNIVGVYDWGTQDGTYFIVMEYIDGPSLSQVIRHDGPLHPRRAAEIASEVAAALGFAHSRGLVHRDVKPGNVLLTRLRSVQGHRLRHRPRPVQRRRRAHAGGIGHGDRDLLLARAGAGSAGRPALGPLLPRGRALRDGHGASAVQRRDTPGHLLQARAGPSTAADQHRDGHPARSRGGRDEAPAQASR